MNEASKRTTNSGVVSGVVLTYFKVHDFFLILNINVIGALNNNSSLGCLRPSDTPVINV